MVFIGRGGFHFVLGARATCIASAFLNAAKGRSDDMPDFHRIGSPLTPAGLYDGEENERYRRRDLVVVPAVETAGCGFSDRRPQILFERTSSAGSPERDSTPIIPTSARRPPALTALPARINIPRLEER